MFLPGAWVIVIIIIILIEKPLEKKIRKHVLYNPDDVRREQGLVDDRKKVVKMMYKYNNNQWSAGDGGGGWGHVRFGRQYLYNIIYIIYQVFIIVIIIIIKQSSYWTNTGWASRWGGFVVILLLGVGLSAFLARYGNRDSIHIKILVIEQM